MLAARRSLVGHPGAIVFKLNSPQIYFSIFSHPPDGTGTLGKQSFLRIEGEFTLPSICNDTFAGSSLIAALPAAASLSPGLEQTPQTPTGDLCACVAE
jgi:hypothetical protein